MKRNLKAPSPARRVHIEVVLEGMIHVTVTNQEDKEWCIENLQQFCGSMFHSKVITGSDVALHMFVLPTYNDDEVVNYIESHLDEAKYNEAGYRIADADYVEKYGVGGNTGRSQIMSTTDHS